MDHPPHEFDAVASALAADGWCLFHGLLDAAQTRALGDECLAMHDARLLQPARVGSGRTASSLRGDSTRWFVDDALSGPQRLFVARLDALRGALNRTLMLGLVDCESHYAVYPPGAGYARHLDCLRGNDARVLSAVFYLNDRWLDTDGGALRLYLASGPHDVHPHAGCLLLFLSARFEHEVLPATRDRMSIAGWMRQRAFPARG
ncbi:MAG: 2OG-Fe(II) oxygenase [Xanthomonadaceae bacterium]|jgi:SM-20-related protein|nr:2OG-Fe(II) oxygenase [Xanthomonadaceae bacterium]